MRALIENLQIELSSNIEKTVTGFDKELQKVSMKINLLNELIVIIDNEQNVILKEVMHDILSSLYSGLQSLYRNAYISVRSAIELALTYVYFVDHNYDFLFWKNDAYDIKWSVLSDLEKGVLNKKYFSMFSDDSYDLLFNSCKSIYKRCSQFVHGKYEYMHTISHGKVYYNEKAFGDYINILDELLRTIISIIFIRHGGSKLKVNESYKSDIEDCLNKYKLTESLKKIERNWE